MIFRSRSLFFSGWRGERDFESHFLEKIETAFDNYPLFLQTLSTITYKKGWEQHMRKLVSLLTMSLGVLASSAIPCRCSRTGSL